MRYLELLEFNDSNLPMADATPAPAAAERSSKVYFHVTTNKRLKSIEANGIEPNHKRRWKTGFGRQLGERGNIYLMSDFAAAVRWAYKQQWEHFAGKPPDPSPYVIICVRENPKNLEADPHPENGLYGHSWFQKQGNIAPEDILKVIPLTQGLIDQILGKNTVAEGLTGVLSNYSPRKCAQMLAARGWSPSMEQEPQHDVDQILNGDPDDRAGGIPDNYINDEYPEYSIDLNIHTADPRGPFTVLRGGRKIMVTKTPPTAQQLGLRDRLF